MPGIGEASTEVSKAGIIQQAVSALKAGGTVYLGENHKQEHGREIAIAICGYNCVQHLCIEYGPADDFSVSEMTEMIHFQEYSALGHKPPIPMKDLINACTDSGGNIVFADNQMPDVTQTERQRHIRDQVLQCRKNVTKVGRGVLVLIGSDHLRNMDKGDYVWEALQEIVYGGLTFTHGRYGSCIMMWQLS